MKQVLVGVSGDKANVLYVGEGDDIDGWTFELSSDVGKSVVRLYDAGMLDLTDQVIGGMLPAPNIRDWQVVMSYVSESEHDGELKRFIAHQSIFAGAMLEGKSNQAKTDKRLEKTNKTKALRKPSDTHKRTGYEKALNEFGGKPERGNIEATKKFWKRAIFYANEVRLFDDDPIYEDIEQDDWDVVWKSARNQIGKIMKK
jgi:hypothetical protein